MADDVLAGADVLVGVSGPGAVSAAVVRKMAARSIVFAMANPVPEAHAEEVGADVTIMATGRSDYPNQINNVLAFPRASSAARWMSAPADQRADEARRRPGHRRGGHRRRTPR